MPRSGWTRRPSTPSTAGACACCANTLSTAKACLSKPDWKTCRPCNAKPCKTIGGAGFTPWVPQMRNGSTAKSPHPPRLCWSNCCRFGATWSATPKAWHRDWPGPHTRRPSFVLNAPHGPSNWQPKVKLRAWLGMTRPLPPCNRRLRKANWTCAATLAHTCHAGWPRCKPGAKVLTSTPRCWFGLVATPWRQKSGWMCPQHPFLRKSTNTSPALNRDRFLWSKCASTPPAPVGRPCKPAKPRAVNLIFQICCSACTRPCSKPMAAWPRPCATSTPWPWSMSFKTPTLGSVAVWSASTPPKPVCAG